VSRPALSGIEGVVIGASAGGVQALAQLLPAFAQGTKAAIFVVLHLPRDRPSLLADVFSPKCALRVREAQDKEPVAPGTVYFAPSNYHLLVDDGPQLALSTDDLVHHSRPSIDVLFESAADVYREHLLGVLLTGPTRTERRAWPPYKTPAESPWCRSRRRLRHPPWCSPRCSSGRRIMCCRSAASPSSFKPWARFG